jgi:hypothetical protein
MYEKEPVPPPPPGIEADHAAFAAYTKQTHPLADELRGTVSSGLSGNAGFDGTAFSRVGRDVGLSDAIRNATTRQMERINRLAGNTSDMADAVRNTSNNYLDQDEERGLRIREAGGDR